MSPVLVHISQSPALVHISQSNSGAHFTEANSGAHFTVKFWCTRGPIVVLVCRRPTSLYGGVSSH